MAASVMTGTYRRIRSAYMPVVVDGALAFRYDPARHVIEWQKRGRKHYIDLAALDESAAQSEDGSKANAAD